DIRMIRTILLAALAVSTLAACAPELNTTRDDFFIAGGYELAGGGSDSRVLAPPKKPPPAQQTGLPRNNAVPRGFPPALPSNEVAAVQERHLAECAKLGCTVLQTRLDRLNEKLTNARASVRIAPDRYPAFAAVIMAPPAEVTTRSEQAEDRTVAVLDVDK